jgi:hypothetical protein
MRTFLESQGERGLDTLIALLHERRLHSDLPPDYTSAAQRSASDSVAIQQLRKQSVRSVALAGLPAVISRTETSTRVFFGHLSSFFIHRRRINSVYAANSVAGELEALKLAATGIQNDDKSFKPHCRQLSLSGAPVADLNELYAAAAEAIEPLRRLLGTACAGVEGVRFDIAPPKGRDRAGKKAHDSYGDRQPGPAEAWLYDIVRSSVYCERGSGLKAVLVTLSQQPGVEVVKSKNRFAKPTPAGFRDVMALVRLRVGSDGFCSHICEIQFHLTAVKTFDKVHDSHSHYEYFRDYFEGAMETVDRRLDDLCMIVGKSGAAGEVEGGDGNADNADNVLCQLVEDVVHANDAARIQAMADLMRDYLCEHELAEFLYRHLVELVTGAKQGAAYHNLGRSCDDQCKYEEALQHYDSQGAGDQDEGTGTRARGARQDVQ